MQIVAGQDLDGEGIHQRLQRRRGGADPAAQGRGLQAHPVAGEDLGLAVERQMVVIFRHDDMGEQPCSGAAAGDRVVWRRRRHHHLANSARQLLANVPDDPRFREGRLLNRPGTSSRVSLTSSAILRSAPPQPGQVHGAGCRRSSLGRWSGNGRRAGFCASAAVSAAVATSGEAVANRSAWSVSSASSASSSCSASRASFSEDRPNSARRYRANWNFSRAISAWAVSASCAIALMIRFSAARSSGRLSAVIGTPAVDQTCSRFGQ
jgi:hypothetical protein